MSILYPRLPRPIAQSIFDAAISELPQSSLHHSAEIYAPVGGTRATDADLQAIVDQIESTAREFGYPEAIAAADRIKFDRAAAGALPKVMPMTWSEAASTDLWSFMALVLVPDVTNWRFGTGTAERWVASDLTRHTWARYWWRGYVFSDHWDAFEGLSESDLNQLLERRGLGGDIPLVTTLAELVVSEDTDLSRRAVIRDVTRRLLRRLAFIDARALEQPGLHELCRRTLDDSIALLRSEPPTDQDPFDEDEDG